MANSYVRLAIRTKLILAIGIPLMTVYLCVLALDYRMNRTVAIQRMQERLSELAEHHAARLDGQFATVAQVARELAVFMATPPYLGEKEMYDVLRNLLKGNPRAYGLCVAFEPNAFCPGRARCAPYVCHSKDGFRSLDVVRDAYDYLRWDWYSIPKRLQHPIWTNPYYGQAGKILMCTYSVPFKRDGNFCGIAEVDISLEDLRAEMEAIKIGGGYCVIVGRTGEFISHPDPSLIMHETLFGLAKRYRAPEYAEVGREMISGKRGLRRIADFRTGAPKWLLYVPIPSCGWSFVAVMPEKQLLAPVHAELRRNAVLLLGEMALVVCLIMVTAIHITRPVSRLAKTVREVALGNLDVQATDIRTGDEIGEFARAFNKMVRDLKAHIEALTRETAEREAVESELRIARGIQASLLPRKFPPFPNRREFSLHALNVPAKQVAGDFFDFYFTPEDRLLVTVADVSGQGVPAAIFMAVTRTLLRSLVRNGLGPRDVLMAANDTLAAENDAAMSVTLFLGLYNTRTGQLRFAGAGHVPPYRLSGKEGALSTLMARHAPPLGGIAGRKFGEEEAALDTGDTLVLYTNGITEARSTAGEVYGAERFEKLLSRHGLERVERICQIVAEAVTSFQDGNLHDDITVLALRRNE